MTQETLLAQAGVVLYSVALLPADRNLLLSAGAFNETTLRSLDAIHVAAAIDISPVDEFVGLRTIAPG